MFFITHDIDEAIILATRIGVMTAGPGVTLKEVVDVDLDEERVRTNRNYGALYERIHASIREEVAAIDLPAGSGRDMTDIDAEIPSVSLATRLLDALRTSTGAMPYVMSFASLFLLLWHVVSAYLIRIHPVPAAAGRSSSRLVEADRGRHADARTSPPA